MDQQRVVEIVDEDDRVFGRGSSMRERRNRWSQEQSRLSGLMLYDFPIFLLKTAFIIYGSVVIFGADTSEISDQGFQGLVASAKGLQVMLILLLIKDSLYMCCLACILG